MSQVGYLPADQKLKRGEIVLQYTKVLEQPDYTPIPFNKQVVSDFAQSSTAKLVFFPSFILLNNSCLFVVIRMVDFFVSPFTDR